jgi:hypothetical protein
MNPALPLVILLAVASPAAAACATWREPDWGLLLTQHAIQQSPGKISVCGTLLGDATSYTYLPYAEGDEIDYFVFRALSTSPVTVRRGTFQPALTLSPYIGREEYFGQFDLMGLFDNFLDNPTPGSGGVYQLEMTRTLDAGGIYVVAIESGERSQYDSGDGFLPWNRDGGGFIAYSYTFDVLGDIEPVQLRRGLPDYTFNTIHYSNIPEPGPSSLGLLGLGALWACVWRRRDRKRGR